MRTADFDFQLPPELIAQAPAAQRAQARLLVLHRGSARLEHRHFHDLPGYLRPGDVLVLNNSRVIPARLRGVNLQTGGQFELLLLEENAVNDWWAMLRPGKRARVGTRIQLRTTQGPSNTEAMVVQTNPEGHRRLAFTGTPDIAALLDTLGEVPLPPYINRPLPGPTSADRQRYQTVFAAFPGSIAAPTAGLHFSELLLEVIRSAKVQVSFVTLHVGLGTFAPVKSDTVLGHHMHEERFELSPEAAKQINAARAAGGRVVAVGTTTVRLLESVAAEHGGELVPGAGKTRIFIHPPYAFKIVEALVTNFHLPRSTLLMLVSAFAAPGQITGRELVLAAYAEAVKQKYRFFSYGDAMLLV